MAVRRRTSKGGKKHEIVDELFDMPRDYVFWRVFFECPNYKEAHDGINGPRWERSLEDIKDIVCDNGAAPYLFWGWTKADDVYKEVKWFKERGRPLRMAKVELSEIIDKDGNMEDHFGWYFALETKDDALQFKLSSLEDSELIREESGDECIKSRL